MHTGEAFWKAVDQLVSSSEIVIDRPRGSAHPRYPGIIYPLDYGFLKDTASMDGAGIDLWRGTDESAGVDAIICTVDLWKRDSEIKLLMNCTAGEKAAVLAFHNESEYMKGILISRDAPAGAAAHR